MKLQSRNNIFHTRKCIFRYGNHTNIKDALISTTTYNDPVRHLSNEDVTQNGRWHHVKSRGTSSVKETKHSVISVNEIWPSPPIHTEFIAIACEPEINSSTTIHTAGQWSSRADSRLALWQWETSLQSNAVSHWLGTNLESALISHHISCHCWRLQMLQYFFSWGAIVICVKPSVNYCHLYLNVLLI